jgi:hypothetical protein
MRLQCGAIICRIPSVSLTASQKVLWENWADAMESGKYSQTTFCMRDSKGFCCLGLACHLLDPDGWSQDGDNYRFQYTAAGDDVVNTDHLPRTVRQQYGGGIGPLGLNIGGRVPDENGYTVPMRGFSLSMLNDSGATFKEMAQIVRKAISGGYAYQIQSLTKAA